MHQITKKANYLIFISFVILTSSCVSHYVPNACPSPGLSEKKELKINGGFTISGAFSGQGQLAYALTKNIGTYIQYSRFSSEPDKFDSLQQWKKGNNIEFGIGYFKKFGKNGNGILEIYPSISRGYVVNQYTAYNSRSYYGGTHERYAGSSRLE